MISCEYDGTNVGRVVWITGLSGSGKSSLANAFVEKIRKRTQRVVLLDGDELRNLFVGKENETAEYDLDARLNLAKQYQRLCKMLAVQGAFVVIATISLFREVHAWNRNNLPRYFEVYLKVPLEELRRRDPKGIYSRFDKGSLLNVLGCDLPIEEPERPDWLIEFDQNISVEQLAETLIERIK